MNQREIAQLQDRIEDEQRTLQTLETARDDRIADLHGLTQEIRLIRERLKTLDLIKEGLA